MIRFVATVLALCLSPSALTAATLKVSAINGTTGLPAVDDQVLLLSAPPGGKLAEIERGKTDANGRLEFTLTESAGSRMVRVIHEGVAYPGVAPAGVASVEVRVYDASRRLDRITAIRDVQRLQTSGGHLEVIEEISLRNSSDPPRTQVGGFEMQLPPGVDVIAGRIRAGEGRAVENKPTPRNQDGRYYFSVPLVPGDTHFGVAYVLPYQGKATINPTFAYPLERLVVMIPKSMKFEPKAPGAFQLTPSEVENVQEMVAVNTAQPLTFRVSGTGTLRHAGNTNASTRLPEAPPRRLSFVGGLALFITGLVAGGLAYSSKQRQFSA